MKTRKPTPPIEGKIGPYVEFEALNARSAAAISMSNKRRLTEDNKRTLDQEIRKAAKTGKSDLLYVSMDKEKLSLISSYCIRLGYNIKEQSPDSITISWEHVKPI